MSEQLCSACSQAYSVPEEASGKSESNCPHCGVRIRILTGEEVRGGMTRFEHAKKERTKRPALVRCWGIAGIIFFLGALLSVLLFFAALFHKETTGIGLLAISAAIAVFLFMCLICWTMEHVARRLTRDE